MFSQRSIKGYNFVHSYNLNKIRQSEYLEGTHSKLTGNPSISGTDGVCERWAVSAEAMPQCGFQRKLWKINQFE